MMTPEELKEHCSIGCAECHKIREAEEPKFQLGDVVYFNSPKAIGHGMEGIIISDTRCELLGSNSYDIFFDEKGITMGFHEKDDSIRLVKKQPKLTDY